MSKRAIVHTIEGVKLDYSLDAEIKLYRKNKKVLVTELLKGDYIEHDKKPFRVIKTVIEIHV